MKKSSPQFLVTFIGLASLASFAPRVHAALPGSDSAANSAYNSGWSNGSNGGTGFSAWSFNGSAGNYSTTSSTTNGNGDNGNPGGGISGDGDIDSAGRAWGLSASGGNIISATRDFTSPLAIGDTFRIRMDTGFIDNGGSDQFALFSASNGIFIRILFTGGTTNYIVQDGANNFDTGIPFTDEGVSISITLTGITMNGAYTYNLSMNTLGAAPFTLSSILNAPAPGDVVTRFALTNNNAGAGADHILYFNDLSVVPEPSSLALLALGAAGAAVLKARRRS